MSENKFIVYTEKNFKKIPQLKDFSSEILEEINVVGNVLPFRINNYVLNHLIDWSNIPEDPIFNLTFPRKGMLLEKDYILVREELNKEGRSDSLSTIIHRVRQSLNPHPADQQSKNVPSINGQVVEGMQHKYQETVLFFPSQGQTCHTYCSFCFRWAQFIGDKTLRFASSTAEHLVAYLKAHKEVTDVVFTGGDPLVAKTNILKKYLEALLDPDLEHVQNIRLGTKALTYWPYRFTTEDDADDLMVLFDKLIKHGKHVALMAHYNHWKELTPLASIQAIKRVTQTGVIIRSQGPLLKHINDSACTWVEMWKTQVKLNIIPYYMFIERDTGANRYFELPLVRCYEIYKEAIVMVSGLCKTVRGPSMSASPGKIEIQGVIELFGETVFILKFIQARNIEWMKQLFFAKFDPQAKWLSDLKPAFGEKKFIFDNESLKSEKTIKISENYINLNKEV